jgi:hypothetical protein
MWYELWAVESGNLLDDFATEADALAAVRAYLAPDVSGSSVDLVLVIYGDDEQPARSIHGPDLAALAGLPQRHPSRRSA